MVSDEAPAEVLYCVVGLVGCVYVVLFVGLYCVVGCAYEVGVGRELTEEVKCAGQDVAFSSCANVPCIRK